MSKNSFLKVIRNYWISDETNLFKNHWDALGGLVVLVLLPLVSLVSLFLVKDYTFWNYIFPLLSISLAGLYDTYSRYVYKSTKNTKLGVRFILNFVAIFMSGLALGYIKKSLYWVSPILLFLSGAVLIVDIFNKVTRAMKVSKWNTYEGE